MNNRRLRALASRQATDLVQLRHTCSASSILDSASDGIICVDLDERITFANPSAGRMVGYAVEELRGQPIGTYFRSGVTALPSAEEITLPYVASWSITAVTLFLH